MPNDFIGNITYMYVYPFDVFKAFQAVLSSNLERQGEGLVLGHLDKFTLSEPFIHIRVHASTSALLESILL